MGRKRPGSLSRLWASIVIALAVPSLPLGSGIPVLGAAPEQLVPQPASVHQSRIRPLVGDQALYDSSVAASRTAAQPAVTQPNIVFVMTDDMRLSDPDRVADLKPGGGFDWLRRNGLRFSRMWSTN